MARRRRAERALARGAAVGLKQRVQQLKDTNIVALVGPHSRCAICDEALDRPFTATSGNAFPREHRLSRYCDAPLHLDCLATWPDREEFSLEYFVGSFARTWRGPGTVLRATARWYLGCGPPVGLTPYFASVHLRDWPFTLYSRWADWTEFVAGGYRIELVGSALDAADEVMAEVRRHAATLEALEGLWSSCPAAPTERRSYAAFGDYLATLWGEEAYYRDWEALDTAQQAWERYWEERDRARARAIAQSNAITQQLLLELEIRGSLLCPHCHERSHRVRFVEKSEEKSYFICGLCGRSFAGSEAT